MKLDWQKVAAAIFMLFLALLSYMGKQAMDRLEKLDEKIDTLNSRVIAIGAKFESHVGGEPFRMEADDGPE
jgi:hypothetical protein